jgi:acylpyruvate hydrolase
LKLATIRTGAGTRAVRVDGDQATVLDASDVGEVLRREDWFSWAAAGEGQRYGAGDLDYAPLVLVPDKIICVGLNYRAHIAESGLEAPTHPALFNKFRSALVGARDDILLPPESKMCDFEAELTVVIGRRARRVTPEKADDFIAGYTIMNDFSMREWQGRTSQWLQGKSWESASPLGPWLVTRDESPGPSRELSCLVDGELRQHADTSDLVFGPQELVSYISTFITLEPGDVIATGTPGGVGLAEGRFLTDGAELVTRIAGLGECRNACRAEDA